MSASLQVVGKRINRVDGVEKALGKAVYIDDMVVPGMLYGKMLRSPIAHGLIKKIDISRALKLTGVKAVITSADLPDAKHGAFIKDTPILARNKVRYIGEPVAAVAAIDEEIAQEALNLINVEYEVLTPVFDVDTALSPDAPLIHEELESYPAVFAAIRGGNVCSRTIFEEGDLTEAFKNSDFIFEDSFTTPMQHQTHLEPNGAIASIDGSGKVTVWTSTQTAHLNQIRIHEVLLIPMNKIRVIGAKIGGGFGAKIEPTVQPIAVALAQKARKPVKVTLTRYEEMATARPRHGSKATIKTGVTKDGKILAREVKLVYDSGAYADDGPGIAGFGGMMSLGPYKIPNYKIDSCCVYTNKLACGAFRGFGNPQSAFATESHMDIIAERLGLDPLEFRLKNALENGDLSVGGIKMPSVGIKECLEKAAKEAEWGKPRQKGRGLGIACMQHISGVLSTSAIVRINEDGTVLVSTGVIDIGQGSDTVLLQIASEELGISVEKISIVSADTDGTPYNWAVSASRATYINGNAVRQAAADAKKQILELAAKFLETTSEKLEITADVIRTQDNPERFLNVRDIGAISHWVAHGPIIGKSSIMVEGHQYDKEKTKGFPFGTMAGFIFGAHIVEVEVDEATGKVQVINVAAAHDVGKAVNPLNVEGQIQGGFIQGLGYALYEELICRNGKILNANLLDYKIPTSTDIPHMTPIIVEERDPSGPFGAKGVGEPGLVATAPAVANALNNAIGVRVKDLPITMEKVWDALKNDSK
jgi:CO/xanthine dehydrogenase Mo-binding subunit